MEAGLLHPPDRRIGPWGFWPTIGFSLIIVIFVYIGSQTVVGVVFAIVLKALNAEFDIASLSSNGLLMAVAVIVSAPLAIAASAVFAYLRRQLPLREYFSLTIPPMRQCLIWLLVTMALVLCSDRLSYLVDNRDDIEFMADAYSTAGFLPLFWLAIVVIAPLSEEAVFRGFLFKGIEHSRLGVAGAVLIGSLGWTALHVQYDACSIGSIFVFGIALGVARYRTGSIYIPTMMHMAWNLVATIQTAIYVAGME
jgi:uncharacterized protein